MEYPPQKHHWVETLAIALIWLAAGWVAWNLMHWVDPSDRGAQETHWTNPRDWH